MTIEEIDANLWKWLGNPERRHAIKYWHARLMRMKGPVTGWRGQK
jgi:hypothetical protein